MTDPTEAQREEASKAVDRLMKSRCDYHHTGAMRRTECNVCLYEALLKERAAGVQEGMQRALKLVSQQQRYAAGRSFDYDRALRASEEAIRSRMAKGA